MGFKVSPQAINVRECNVYLSDSKSKNQQKPQMSTSWWQ